MKKYFNKKILLLFISLFYFLVVTSSSLIIFFTTELISNLQSHNRTKVNLHIILITVFVVIFIISSFMNLLWKNKWNYYINLNLNNDVINKISTLTSLEVEKNDQGKYLSWIKFRIPEIRRLVFNMLFSTTLNFLTNLITLILLFIVSWKLSLIGLSILFMSFILPIFLSVIAGSIHNKFNKEQEKIMSLFTNVFKGFEMLFYLGKEEKILLFIDNLILRLIKSIDKKQSKVIVIELLSSSVQQLSNTLFLFLIGYFILFLNEPISSLFVLPSLFLNFSINLREFLFLLQNVISYKTYIKEFSNYSLPNNNFEKIQINEIRFENLSFKYNEDYVFKDFTFTFLKNKKYAIIGKSGSGKSTLIKILLKQINNYEGNIYINNKNLKEIHTNDLINSLTFLDTSENLFYDSIYNNITLWEENQFEKAINSLEKADLKDLDINLTIDENQNLSTGQKQKINFARFFYRNHNTLITDESFSNIDKDSVKRILSNLKETLLINITHNIVDSSLYDEVINIERN
ncbi:ABC transporter ATP-binding protein [Mycoplasmopsis felis]|uniref:ABC transporter ATP-binding protein n=1 Tax=Mycoplasmopsis felis TaxID=33923 RepID=UPI002AFE1BB7|nr:ABC transporter ATP-binding protein [Mycoplasmopsis felis]WQQ03770.1 ABC transporter ATP-binding protein [Mycoplasmopsis felis]